MIDETKDTAGSREREGEPGIGPRLLHPTPGFIRISPAERQMFYISRHLSTCGKRFASIEELNNYLRTVGQGQLELDYTPTHAFEKAQLLVYKGVTATKKKRVSYANEALSVYPNCADAYVVMAQDTKDPHLKLELLEQGVTAAEAYVEELRQLGLLRELSWDTVLARPYFRVRFARALALAELGMHNAAVPELEELLSLNPGDNQGVRYVLLSNYLRLKQYDKAKHLLQSSDEPSAIWRYTQALMAFLESKDEAIAQRAVLRAFYQNAYVPGYLTGQLHTPKRLPEYWELGHNDEAMVYAGIYGPFWHGTPGAMDWFESSLHKITGGTTPLFGYPNLWVRQNVFRVTHNYLFGKPLTKRDRKLIPAIESHRFFDHVWLGASQRETDELMVGDDDPVNHIALHLAVDSLIKAQNPAGAAASQALKTLTEAGMVEHQAIHVIGAVLADMWFLALQAKEPLDLVALQAKLQYLAKAATGSLSEAALTRRLSRNDPCPCGSQRKFKKCCGSDPDWPLPFVASIARHARYQPSLKTWTHETVPNYLMRTGRFEDPSKEIGLPDNDVLVELENRSFVVEELCKQGYPAHAFLAAKDNLDAVLSTRNPRYLVTALEDLITVMEAVGDSRKARRYRRKLNKLKEKLGM
ncbi:MAG: DUF1841 family protein [Bacillota bacterium]